jgi:hypothetical protein
MFTHGHNTSKKVMVLKVKEHTSVGRANVNIVVSGDHRSLPNDKL